MKRRGVYNLINGEIVFCLIFYFKDTRSKEAEINNAEAFGAFLGEGEKSLELLKGCWRNSVNSLINENIPIVVGMNRKNSRTTTMKGRMCL